MAAQLRRVYLIEEGGMHKIGSSKDPSVRLAQVARSGRVVHHFPSADSYRVERALQKRFEKCRVRALGREWFRLTPEDVDLFCRLSRTDAPDDLPPELQPRPDGGRVAHMTLSGELFGKLLVVAEEADLDIGATVNMIVAERIDEYLQRIRSRRLA